MLPRQPIPAIPIADAALFLDLDGVIVPIAAEPDQVRASSSCRIVIQRVREHLRGRLAILSERTIEDVDKVLGDAIPCVAGVHGLQRRTPVGGLVLDPPHARVADAAAVLVALARARAGLVVEEKGASVAIHYRNAPEAEAAVVETVERLAHASGLEVQRGKMVMELRTPGPDKGAALNRFMLEAPFTGATPIFIGDDLTDEVGFAAARALGGIGVLVGDASETLAQSHLEDSASTLSWLMKSLDSGRFEFSESGWAA